MWKDIFNFLVDLFKKNKDKNKEPEFKEDLDIKSIKWLGSNYSGATMERLINSASMDNKFIYTNYNAYNWPMSSDKACDAICCLFYQKNSDIVGGKFDWWRKGGQGTKTLENVHGGYQGHTWPSSTSRVWTCIVSVDTKKRSNIVEVKRK